MASADKFYTVYVLDSAPSMAEHFSAAKTYVESCLSAKLLKGKVLDQVNVISVHPGSVDIVYERLDPKRPHGKHAVTPTFEDLKEFREKVQVKDTEGDSTLLDGVTKALECMGRLLKKDLTDGHLILPTERLTIVALTNCKRSAGWESADASLLKRMLRAANVVLSVVNFGQSSKEEQTWLEFFESLPSQDKDTPYGQRYLLSSLMRGESVMEATLGWQKAPVTNTYRPLRAFQGEIRIGCDVYAEEMDTFKKPGEPGEAPQSRTLRMNAEVNTLLKKEPALGSHTKGVTKNGNGQFVPATLRTIRTYHTTEDNKPVDSYKVQKRYKFGASEVNLSDVSTKVLKMVTLPAIDVINFQKRDTLPFWYFVHEPVLVTHPLVDRNTKSEQLFNLLCETMIQMDSVAIVRYVAKPNTPVAICAMIPQLAADNRSQSFQNVVRTLKRERSDSLTTNHLDGVTYSFVLVRLPYREDEMVASFAAHTQPDEEPTPEMLGLLEELMDVQDLDKRQGCFDEKRGREQKYLEYQSYPDLTFPDPAYHSRIYNDITEQLLAQRNPMVETTSLVLREIVSRLDLSDPTPIFHTLLEKPHIVDEAIDTVVERTKPYEPSLERPVYHVRGPRAEDIVRIFDNAVRPVAPKQKARKNDKIVAGDAPPLDL